MPSKRNFRSYSVKVSISKRDFSFSSVVRQKDPDPDKAKTHLIRELRRAAVSGRFHALYPVGDVAHKVEEKVAFRRADHLVGDLHEQREAFGRFQAEARSDVGAEVLGARARVHLEGLERVER